SAPLPNSAAACQPRLQSLPALPQSTTQTSLSSPESADPFPHPEIETRHPVRAITQTSAPVLPGAAGNPGPPPQSRSKLQSSPAPVLESALKNPLGCMPLLL